MVKPDAYPKVHIDRLGRGGEFSGLKATIRDGEGAKSMVYPHLELVIHMQPGFVKPMLKHLVDLLILETVSVVYSMAVFCLKRRQA
jgi:hypothetical protein